MKFIVSLPGSICLWKGRRRSAILAIWVFIQLGRTRQLLWPLLGSADVSVDVCRHTDGSQDKGKAGAQRQIKERQREKGVLTAAAPLTPISGREHPYLINSVPFLSSWREKTFFSGGTIVKEREIIFSIFKNKVENYVVKTKTDFLLKYRVR